MLLWVKKNKKDKIMKKYVKLHSYMLLNLKSNMILIYDKYRVYFIEHLILSAIKKDF